jgi:hypothetical protein
MKIGTTFQMDSGNMTTQIITANTKNCPFGCSKCDRWNTKALPTLVNSMEKKGKDADYMQRTLDNVLKKDYACEKQVEETKPVKKKYRVGGVRRWRQHGHGKRITIISKAKCIVPFVTPGNERKMEAEPEKVEKQVSMDKQEEQTDWVEVTPPRRRQLRTESRNRARHMHKYGGDEKISVRKYGGDEEISVRAVEIDKKNKIEKPRRTLENFFRNKKKKPKTRKSTKKWEKPQMTDKPESPSYIHNFPELKSDNEEDEEDEVKVKKVNIVKETFYDRQLIKHIMKTGFDTKATSKAPRITTKTCVHWSGEKGRDGCRYGRRCEHKHCKLTCPNYIKTGKCANQYCRLSHTFTEDFIPGKEASDAPAIRRKMWMDRKKKRKSGQRKSGVRKPPGPGYVCHCCNKPGHWKQDCPTSRRRAFYR